MQFRNNARSGDDQRHGAIRRNEIDGAPSAAWLEAQQAFSVQRPAAGEPAVVIVRKGKALATAEPVVEATPDQPGPPAQKVARVFRVVSSQGASARAVRPHPDHDDSLSDGEWFGIGRKRRFDAAKRPGPVLLTLAVAPIQAEMTGQSKAQAHEAPVLDQVAELHAMLARVDAVLDDVRRARAFQFVDENSASSWARLSNAAAAMQKQLDRWAARLPGRNR